MKYSLICYFDTELEKYYPPFLVPQSVEDAIESMMDAGKKGKIEDVGTKKAFFLGQFDTEDAKIALLDSPKMIVDLTIFGQNVQ